MRGLLSIVAVALVSAALAAQAPPQGSPAPGQPPTPGQRTPPRAGPARPGEPAPSGTAVLRGQVVSVDGTPLRRAQVRAMSQDGRPGGGVASTDAQGRFEIRELAASRYVVSASKAGYVTMQFGQRRADQVSAGTLLDVLDGQVVEKIQFALPRGGVITGRVLDEFGEPIAGAQVTAQRNRYFGGARRMMRAGGDTTDDQGSFRIYGLPPGDYYVSGTVRSVTMFELPTVNNMETDGYAPSYFPGTANVGEAQRISVKGGQEASGINFALTATRLARVRGRVTTASGEPPPSIMSINAMSRDMTTAMTMSMNGTQTRGDGTFQLSGLTPGTYNVTARVMGMPNAQQEVAQAQLTVAGEDVDNFLLVLSRGAIARGVITTDDGSPLPSRPNAVRVFVTPAEPNVMNMVSPVPTVNDDWTFEVSGLFERGFFRAGLQEAGEWALKAVYYRDQDITDAPFEFTPGQTLEGIQVVFTRKGTELTGMVRDANNQPVLDSTVVIFAGDPSKWGFQSRYLRTARVDQQGRFRIRHLPPFDDYRVVAVNDLEEGRSSDPEFLESVRDQSARVSLAEGQTATQDLKVQQVRWR